MHLAAALNHHQRPSPIVEPSGRTMRLTTGDYDDRPYLERLANRLNRDWVGSADLSGDMRNIWVRR